MMNFIESESRARKNIAYLVPLWQSWVWQVLRMRWWICAAPSGIRPLAERVVIQ